MKLERKERASLCVDEEKNSNEPLRVYVCFKVQNK